MSNLVPYNDMERMAGAMAKSGFFGFKTSEQAMSIMLIAQAQGMHPATAALDYDVIQNRPAKKPQAMLRDFIASGGKVEWHKSDDTAADATFAHPQGGSVRVKWDMKRATQMGLAGKDNYKKQPGVMFRWRCVSEGVRIVFPGATGGLYSPEEVSSFTPSEPPTSQAITVESQVDSAEATEAMLNEVHNATTMDELKNWFKAAKEYAGSDAALLAKVTEYKDARKAELSKAPAGELI